MTPPTLISALGSATRQYPLTRKSLVCADINYARELLGPLALHTGGWIGWEGTTLRQIAEELAFVSLANQDKRAGTDIGIGGLVNRALDELLQSRKLSPSFASLQDSLGFRHLVRDSVLELRTAGVRADQIRARAANNSAVKDLAAVLERYEALLSDAKLVDPAGIFHVALEEFKNEAPCTLAGAILFAPSVRARGLAGRLADLLVSAGAVTVGSGERGDPLSPHVTFDCFAGATPSEELREAFRRIMAENVRVDDVELVATDTDAYGIALDGLCQQLNIGATMLHGIPLSRTRLGRALDRWLAWLSDGLPADILRHALEAGEIASPDATLASTVLARELRWLKIGWGRKRYLAAIARLRDKDFGRLVQRDDEETDEEYGSRVESRRRPAVALASLLEQLMAITPEVPERGDDRRVLIAPSVLARATIAWLDLFRPHGIAEQDSASRLRSRLEQLSLLEDSETGFSNAIAALRDGLGDMRAWPQMTSDKSPWLSAGGMVHLTNLAHAGTTGRPRVFVLGLSAENVSGGRENPLLTDAARTAIAPGDLATSVELREERAEILATALASLRGRVTLSYATSGSLDGRESGPAPIMLQAWRKLNDDPTITYEQMRAALSPPACAVPERSRNGAIEPRALLDARDVWLDSVADGPLLLDGRSLIRNAFAKLNAGLSAFDFAELAEFTAYHGLIGEPASTLDPRADGIDEISPSALERLAKCPLQWFYHYGLDLRIPEDVEYDPTRWLDVLQRGSLLHEVFESFTRRFLKAQNEAGTAKGLTAMRSIVDEALTKWREDVPPPGEAVFHAEAVEIHHAARAFVEMERAFAQKSRGRRWLEFERFFGGRNPPPGQYVLSDGSVILLNGRIDRIDELEDGSLCVIDYKTGKSRHFSRDPKTGPFKGGRQMQPAIYASALSHILGREVSSFEYRFPTERGGHEVIPYGKVQLEAARSIVTALLTYVERGMFVPTNDSQDCGYCNYQAICRARKGEWKTDSPRANWAERNAATLPVYEELLAVRARPNG